MQELELDSALSDSSLTQSLAMAKDGKIYHSSSLPAGVGENVEYFTKNACGPTVGEIADCAVTNWMDSAGHKANILRTIFSQTGVGVAVTEQSYYFTQQFS